MERKMYYDLCAHNLSAHQLKVINYFIFVIVFICCWRVIFFLFDSRQHRILQTKWNEHNIHSRKIANIIREKWKCEMEETCIYYVTAGIVVWIESNPVSANKEYHPIKYVPFFLHSYWFIEMERFQLTVIRFVVKIAKYINGNDICMC